MDKAGEVAKGKNRGRARKKGELDGVYLILLCALVCAGLLMLISASTPDSIGTKSPYSGIIKNCIVAAVSFVFMLIVANAPDYMLFRRYVKLFYIICVILMFLTPVIGRESLGATRWIYIGPVSVQPSEIMKIALILYLADVLSSEKKRDVSKMNLLQRILYSFRAEIIILIPALGAVLQRHLSGAVIICAIGFIMLFAHGMPVSHIAGIGGGVVAAGVALAVLEPYRMERILGYRNPEADPLGNGWQILQSLYAICSGGLFGVGFGQSRQKYNWLPEASNDYIFAIICEELGIIGGIAVIVMFGLFVWRGVKISVNAREMFGSLIAFGVSVMIGMQVVINIAVVTNLIPSTGMQLPFFSSGGTSLLFMLIATGIVLNISRYQKRGAGVIHKIK
ncbi:MAG: putative lipid II flippase FtsW [Clostridia bacterium]|nr:putative lipid II flippase FtsW [Clostridia bacterium]